MTRSTLRAFTLVSLFLANLLTALPVYAQASGGGGPCTSTDTIDKCIVNIYRWSLGAAVLLALFMIIWAGYRYVTAGGNAQAITGAKEMFAGAFIGLIILFAAVIILRTLNPDFAAPPALPPL